MENELSIDKARKPHAYIEFGGPGHEMEYVFTTQANKYSEAQELPSEWENKLMILLGEGWSIMNFRNRFKAKRNDKIINKQRVRIC